MSPLLNIARHLRLLVFPLLLLFSSVQSGANDGGECISAEEAESLQSELQRKFSTYLKSIARVQRDAAALSASGLFKDAERDAHSEAAALPGSIGGSLLPTKEDLNYAGEQLAINNGELAAISNRLDNTYTAVRAVEIGGTIISTATGVGGVVKTIASGVGKKIIAQQLAKGALAAGATVAAAEGAYHGATALGLNSEQAGLARDGIYALANIISGAKTLKDARAISKGFNGKGCSAPKNKLYHYTDDAGLEGITKSQRLNPSLKANNPKDARFGDGQYLSDIVPGTKTKAQLSREFLGIPFQGNKFKNYVEIDVTGLPVKQGRDGVFVLPNDKPLSLDGRIIGTGTN